MFLLISKRYMYLIINLTPFRLSRLNVRYKEYFGYFLPRFLFSVLSEYLLALKRRYAMEVVSAVYHAAPSTTSSMSSADADN